MRDETAEERRSFSVLLSGRVIDLLTERYAAEKSGDRMTAERLSARIEEVRFLQKLAPKREGFWTEINPEEAADRLDPAKQFLAESMNRICFALHDKETLRPGEQWTISLGESCGYKGEVRFRTEHLGTCSLKGVTPEGDERG